MTEKRQNGSYANLAQPAQDPEASYVWGPATDRFLYNLPEKPWCSSDKRLKYHAIKDIAMQYIYVSTNFPLMKYFIFDLDYQDSMRAVIYKGLPPPTLTAVSRDSGHSHVFYELKKPMPNTKSSNTRASKESISLLKDLKWYYKELLNADRCITSPNQLVKNCLRDDFWHVSEWDEKYSLRDLVDAVPYALKQAKISIANENSGMQLFDFLHDYKERSFEETLVPYSRNCSLFENTRFYAYNLVAEGVPNEDLFRMVLRHLEIKNMFDIPKHFPVTVSIPELRGIAKSITKYVIENRSKIEMKSVNTGAMKFPSLKGTSMTKEAIKKEIANRRILSADRTNQIRRVNTRQKIIEATELHIKENLKLTVQSIANVSGVNRQNIYRNHNDLIRLIKQLNKPQNE